MNMSTIPGEKVGHFGKQDMIMPVALVILSLVGFYYGGGWIYEPHSSWSMKLSMFLIASILMVGIITILGVHVLKTTGPAIMVSRQNLKLAVVCFVISSVIGSFLLVFTTSDLPVDSFEYGLYGVMLVMLAFGVFSLGTYSLRILRDVDH